ncbi:MAG: hypothetical protein CBD27_04170 [Rhodospirillaceae bacterium TMED167]|nr:hypothetical protein [Rhodospirillaceae bacterium]OUW28719.1 MAG: hypothetical protein CBD27_04170 [Rhodospirillaceae bacterium TMED167]
MSYGVTQQMIETYGEIIFKLSLNKQSRRGDAVRELNFEEIERQREITGLTDDEIAARIGLLPEQVGVVRVFVERKYHRIDLHRRLFHLGGGKRWKANEYQHPAERLKIREENMALRESLTFHPERAQHYLEQGYWKNDTLIQWLNGHAAERPEAPAIITETDIITWVDLKDRVDQLTNGLMGLGLMKGDVVAVQLPNVPEFMVAHVAISAFGGVMQTIHMPYGKTDIEFFLTHSGARAVVCLPDFKEFPTAQVMTGFKANSTTLKDVIVLGPEAPEGAVTFSSLLQEGKPVIGNPPVGSDPYLLLYTSGTTSNPKGVPLTYQNMLGHGRLCAPEFEMIEDDRVLSAAPLSHLYGLYNINCAFAAGAAMVMLPAFSPPDLARVVEATQTTAIFMGPAHAAAYRGTDILQSHDFSSVKYSVFSGAYSPPDVMTYWGEQTGSALCQLWGMTELAAGTFSRPGMDVETATRSAGPAAPGNEVRVVSAETGAQLSANEEGELQVRGASVFPGYLNNPDANAEAFTCEGWFRTGDLATIDGQGNLTITGRIKDIINRGGVKYNPADIEEIIFTHPKVAMTAIVPMEDEKLGERACCFVQLVSGETTDLAEITAFLAAQNISKNKWPERLETVKDMPLTPTRKVIKGKLAALLED